MSKLKVDLPRKVNSRGLYVTVGVWQKSKNTINVALPGAKIHVPINNKEGTSRYQPHLFKALKGLLEEQGRWQVG